MYESRAHSWTTHICTSAFISLTPDVQKGARSSPFVFNIFFSLSCWSRAHTNEKKKNISYAFVYSQESIEERQLRINRKLFRSYTNILGYTILVVCVCVIFFFIFLRSHSDYYFNCKWFDFFSAFLHCWYCCRFCFYLFFFRVWDEVEIEAMHIEFEAQASLIFFSADNLVSCCSFRFYIEKSEWEKNHTQNETQNANEIDKMPNCRSRKMPENPNTLRGKKDRARMRRKKNTTKN